MKDTEIQIESIDIFEINSLKDSLNKLREYAKSVGAKSPKEAVDALKDEISGIIFNPIRTYENGEVKEKCVVTATDLKVHKAILFVKNNIDAIMSAVDKTKNKKGFLETQNHKYGDSFNLTIKELTRTLYSEYLSSKGKTDKFLNEQLNSEEKENLKKFIMEVCQNADKDLYETIKKGYIHRIITIASFLDKCGALKQYCQAHDKKIQDRGLDEILNADYDERKGNKKQITSAKLLTNKQIVEKLTIQELIALSSFLTNRIAKEDIDLNKLIYVLEEEGLLDEAFEDTFDEDKFKTEKTKRNLVKFDYIRKQIRKKTKHIMDEVDDNLRKGIPDSRIDKTTKKLKIETGPTQYEIDKCKEEYESYFGDETFAKDFIRIENLLPQSNGLYKLKDSSTESLLIYLLTSLKGINWGYVPEYDENGHNSLQRRERNVLIAINFEGFNSTFALHVDLSSLIKLTEQLTDSTSIPVFQGQEAMEYKRQYKKRNYSVPMLLKLTKDQRAYIKKKSKTISADDENYKYIKHLNWLIDGNEVPEYLLDSDGILKEERVSLNSGAILSEKEAEEIFGDR